MNKPVVFLKSHVDTFTRKDGVVVEAHDTKVQAKAKASAAPDAPVTKTKNEGMGFHGAAMNSHRYETHGPDGDARSEADHRDQYQAADEAFSRTAHSLVQGGHFANHEQARDYLDSTHGRHLGDATGHRGDIGNVKWLGRSVKDYKKQAGIFSAPHEAGAPVKIHSPGHALHGTEGKSEGADPRQPGRIIVKHAGGRHSVHKDSVHMVG